MKPSSLLLFTAACLLMAGTKPGTKSEPKAATKKAETKTSSTSTPKQGDIAEYKIILDEKYETFRTRIFQKLELTENCFKNEKPTCQAYSVSLEKGPKVTLDQFGSNNKAALNCKNMGGKNLVALDKDRNEFGFCKFGDGSMVTIWSMYFKTNPAPTIK